MWNKYKFNISHEYSLLIVLEVDFRLTVEISAMFIV